MHNPTKNVGDDLTYKVIGCAMRVHQTLGGGFQEVIYQRCLAIEMDAQGLLFEREKPQPIYYSDVRVGTRRADFVVEKKMPDGNHACLSCHKPPAVQLVNMHSHDYSV